jgi:mono/diheme cytochrome c family protein
MEPTGTPEGADDTPKTFGWLYTLAVWAGAAFAVLLAAWLFWTLFVHTASGANRGLSVTLSKATQTAVYEVMPTPTKGAGVVELPAACRGCHTIAGTNAAGVVGPELTHVATDAAKRIAAADYKGQAKTVEEYIHESIMDPNAYIVPDKPSFANEGKSVMPAAIGQTLSAAQLAELVKYLASLK